MTGDPGMYPEYDLRVEGGGSIYAITMLTEVADAWVSERVDVPDYMWLGEARFAVEPRFVAPIIAAAQSDGLTLNWDALLGGPPR